MIAIEALKESSNFESNRIIAARVDGRLIDLYSEIQPNEQVQPIYMESSEGQEILRHSTAHVMAMAVKELFPEVKITIGPAIEDGFYYDFDYKRPFREEDLPEIEDKMREIVGRDIPFKREEISKEDAIKLFSSLGEHYKVEILHEIEDETVSVYRNGDFVDLCRGPHVPSTGFVRSFKLMKVAGAYWRGDEKRKMLSRIYGVAFPSDELLRQYLKRLEEAKKRYHIRLGKELELFSIHEEVGAGLIIWHPKGAILRHIIEEFEIEEHLRRGYEMVKGPQLLKTELWKRSGHFENYKENMYFTEIDKQSYGIKPMNCLAHMLIYNSKIRSYRELPKRYFELGLVHRHERSGVLHGLLRVREFTQDDAHIICAPDQLNNEIKGVLQFVDDVMGIFGFEYELELSTRPEKSIGSDEDWERATSALEGALRDLGLDYDINEGEGAFYGPKIDVKLKDALQRRWQCATIQCDFTLPERFDLLYVDKDGQRKRPVMIHRVVLGAIERFIGVLIEHYGGAFPLWLSPVQAIVLSLADRHVEFGYRALNGLKEAGIRVEEDFRNEKLGLKVREAQLKKIPYMVIIGDKEVKEQRLTVRLRDGTNISLMIEELIERIRDECKKRR
ncbi:MAG TPA: threonine--tRNA ligase [Desulfobacteraceae bacterium]|nr:threonine--tRNA ligase [Desulfobacteraceae bacterium]